MKKKIISTAVLFTMLGITSSVLAAGDTMMEKQRDTMMMKHEMNIVDVTAWAEIRGVTTSSDAAGYATISYSEEDGYKLHGAFEWLTDPLGDDFYEGWIVRKEPFAFVSTGKLEKEDDGKYHDYYESSIDYSEYDFYVLTLEPNDGNDAPADHILEGDVMMAKMMMHDDNMVKSEEDSMMKDSMMKDSMMDKPDMMKSEMMEKEMTPRQKALRVAIKKQLEKVDSSKFDVEAITERIDAFKATIDSRNYSAVKKARTIELLDALLEVLTEMKMISEDTMMMDK